MSTKPMGTERPLRATQIENERPLRADARRNRARIIDAARKLFAGEQANVQMDDIARHARVGVGTVYRHFPDKEALMGELVRQRFELFNENLRHALADEHSGAFAALATALRANLTSVAEDAATRFAFMSGGERVFAHAATEMEEFMLLANELVGRARDTGELRDDFQASDIPMVMCGICATIGVNKPDWDWQHYLDLILHGMHRGAAM
ncbi:MAG TPA: helix-turn-helix domain-containing protein [Solirubrobacteraceae bacterium]|nr:helix-turn-helix domain-containing protein [Solirubrobacteraceae bacterium]